MANRPEDKELTDKIAAANTLDDIVKAIQEHKGNMYSSGGSAISKEDQLRAIEQLRNNKPNDKVKVTSNYGNLEAKVKKLVEQENKAKEQQKNQAQPAPEQKAQPEIETNQNDIDSLLRLINTAVKEFKQTEKQYERRKDNPRLQEIMKGTMNSLASNAVQYAMNGSPKDRLDKSYPQWVKDNQDQIKQWLDHPHITEDVKKELREANAKVMGTPQMANVSAPTPPKENAPEQKAQAPKPEQKAQPEQPRAQTDPVKLAIKAIQDTELWGMGRGDNRRKWTEPLLNKLQQLDKQNITPEEKKEILIKEVTEMYQSASKGPGGFNARRIANDILTDILHVPAPTPPKENAPEQKAQAPKPEQKAQHKSEPKNENKSENKAPARINIDDAIRYLENRFFLSNRRTQELYKDSFPALIKELKEIQNSNMSVQAKEISAYDLLNKAGNSEDSKIKVHFASNYLEMQKNKEQPAPEQKAQAPKPEQKAQPEQPRAQTDPVKLAIQEILNTELWAMSPGDNRKKWTQPLLNKLQQLDKQNISPEEKENILKKEVTEMYQSASKGPGGFNARRIANDILTEILHVPAPTPLPRNDPKLDKLLEHNPSSLSEEYHRIRSGSGAMGWARLQAKTLGQILGDGGQARQEKISELARVFEYFKENPSPDNSFKAWSYLSVLSKDIHNENNKIEPALAKMCDKMLRQIDPDHKFEKNSTAQIKHASDECKEISQIKTKIPEPDNKNKNKFR